jgi:outer membrane protein assembly factor BamB
MKLEKYGPPALARAATLGLAGCMGQDRHPPPSPETTRRAADVDPDRPAVDEEAVKKFGFVLYWDSFIDKERLTSISLEGDFEQGFGQPKLYAFTASNRLYQVDLHSGMIHWMYDVGQPLSFADKGRPVAEWLYKKDKDTNFKRYDEVYFVARDHLYALDKESGAELWSVRLPFGASSAPWTSSTHVYVGSWDDRLYAFRKDDHDIPDWSWRTNDDLLTRGASESPQTFAATSDGDLMAFDAANGEPRWTFRTEKRLLQDPLLYQKLLYVPGEDFNLYVLNAIDGLLEYRHCPGAPISTRPVAVNNGDEKTIYYTASEEGVFALARKHRPRPQEGNPRKTIHELLWQRKEATRFLCRGAHDVYVLEPKRDPETGAVDPTVTRIARLDADKGTFRDAIELPAADWVLTAPYGPASSIREEGLLGGMVVLGWRNGWVITLKEIATLPGGVVDEGK